MFTEEKDSKQGCIKENESQINKSNNQKKEKIYKIVISGATGE